MLEPLTSKLNQMRIVLASSSVQRAALLNSVRLKYEIIPSSFEENLNAAEHTFSEFVEQTALGKAKDVYNKLKSDPIQPDLIIAVDTMVAFNGKMYGKPKNREEAIQTITDLTSTNIPNSVYTGVVVMFKGQTHKFTEVTNVYMTKLTKMEVEAYVDTNEPMGKAGGYGIQGIASTFVERIEGDCNNVIGLPLCRLFQLLKQLVLLQTSQ